MRKLNKNIVGVVLAIAGAYVCGTYVGRPKEVYSVDVNEDGFNDIVVGSGGRLVSTGRLPYYTFLNDGENSYRFSGLDSKLNLEEK